MPNFFDDLRYAVNLQLRGDRQLTAIESLLVARIVLEIIQDQAPDATPDEMVRQGHLQCAKRCIEHYRVQAADAENEPA